MGKQTKSRTTATMSARGNTQIYFYEFTEVSLGQRYIETEIKERRHSGNEYDWNNQTTYTMLKDIEQNYIDRTYTILEPLKITRIEMSEVEVEDIEVPRGTLTNKDHKDFEERRKKITTKEVLDGK